MSYIKERKKRKASKFHIASPFDGDELKDNLFGGAEEHNLSQSIHSDSVSFASVSDSPAGGEEENDGAASSRSRAVDYQLHFQQLRLQVTSCFAMGSMPKLCSQVEVQQKIIADFEAGKLAWDARQAELNKEVPDMIKFFFNLFVLFPRLRREERRIRGCRRGRKGERIDLFSQVIQCDICRLEILIQDLREKLQHLESENRNLTQRINEQSPITDHQKELLLQNRFPTSTQEDLINICLSKG